MAMGVLRHRWTIPHGVRGVRPTGHAGFTVIEMLVVMTVVALLVSVMAPAYIRHVDHAREVVLKQNLTTVRDAIDKYKSDQGRLPANLQEMVTSKYLRTIPVDPITDRADAWILTPATDGSGGIIDIHSGATGTATDGSRYASW